MKTMTIRLSGRQANLLDAVAHLDNKTAVQVVREALDRHISERFQDPGFQHRLRQAAEEIRRLPELAEESEGDAR